MSKTDLSKLNRAIGSIHAQILAFKGIHEESRNLVEDLGDTRHFGIGQTVLMRLGAVDTAMDMLLSSLLKEDEG